MMDRMSGKININTRRPSRSARPNPIAAKKQIIILIYISTSLSLQKTNKHTHKLPVKPVVRVAGVRVRVIAAEVIAGLRVL